MAILIATAAPSVSAAEKTVFVNVFKCREDKSEAVFLKQPDGVDKSDASMIVELGKKGMDVYLIDGGMPNGTMLKALNSLRSYCLKQIGAVEEEKNTSYKLKINLIVTHFHQDHVNELVNMVLSNKRFAVDRVYYASPTALSVDGEYDNARNSDVNERLKFFEALDANHRNAKKTEVKFGSRLKVNTARGCFTFFAPVHDWGAGKWLEYIKDTYYADADTEKLKKDVPTAVINANSMFIKYEADGKAVLFPGDVMKKKEVADEPLDLMIAKYKDDLRADVVKYPHHGIERNAALEDVEKKLLKDRFSIVVISSGKAEKISAPLLKDAGIDYRNSGLDTVIVSLSRDGMNEGTEFSELF
jgi:hypothetical protein